MDDKTKTQIEAVREHPLFDAEWYARTYPDVQRRRMDPAEHYVMLGGRVQYKPSEAFDMSGYLKAHPELRYNRVPALVHLIESGEEAYVKHHISFVGKAVTSAFTGKTPHNLKLEQFKHPVNSGSPLAFYDDPVKISAVIPTAGKDLKLLDKCVKSLRDIGEIILVANGAHKEAVAKRYGASCVVVQMEGGFNWSAANNVGVAKAQGEYILFCNDDVESEAGWATALLNAFHDPRVKVIAPVLRHPDRRIQSAGCYRVPQGCTSQHIVFAPVRDRFVESVMGAAFLVRKSTVQYTPFDVGYGLIMAETDFCLRVGGCVVKHDVQITHHERTTRGKIDPPEDIQRFMERHPLPAANYYHSQWIPVGRARPLRVLFMKLDHIGDAALAQEAVAQWRHQWGDDIEISWLVNPVAAALFPGENTYTYLYFQEGASDGLAPQKPGQWEAFVKTLPEFDVVVDLRLHGCTSKLLSAWDNMGTVCYAMGVGGIPPYNYVNPKGVVHSRQITSALLGWLPFYTPQEVGVGGAIVVCRAASGYVKKWPDGAWQALVDVLKVFGLEVIELLSPGMPPLERTDAYAQVPLKDLGAWISANARLYIGHDSGPTHIAAQAGVQVVEVVGGLVAPLEWQGVGDSVSVSMPQRCGPCYVNPCKQGSPVCIQSVDVNSVIYAVRQMFREGGMRGVG